MSRKEKILNCFNARDELSIDNARYQDFTRRLFNFLLEEDLGKGDVSQYPPAAFGKKIECAIIVKEEGVVAGLEEIIFLLGQYRVKVLTDFLDGDIIKIGDVLLKLQGEAGKILALERTVLNILQRFCGIATMTARYQSRIGRQDCFIIGTRKTLFGFWDKKAVQSGGGLTHRLNLEDAVMLKENHLDLLKKNGVSIFETLENIIRKNKGLRFIEIEVTYEQEFWEMARNLEKVKFDVPKVLMFDHFTVHQIRNLIEEMQKRGIYDDLLLEASGDITLETVSSYAEAGIDVISSGALTHSVKGLDLTLLFNYQNK
ncbi:MAG: carboxylating nicotinate-nucleotide diphosphorylase [Candidatus Marinimicrobia bacterium]|nr:carboxylating nicotinate-nucleotide diphosphorylase [Candidatus Neomarinimicrobiota bacterium]